MEKLNKKPKSKVTLRLRFNDRGQALLIVVLIMVVALTVGLSVGSRSITNLRTSTEEENSQRAFSAAEAGIEQALKVAGTGTVIANKQFGPTGTQIQQVDITAINWNLFLMNGGNTIPRDEGADLWLSPTDFSSPWTGTLTLYWGSSTDSCTSNPPTMAAIEVTVISGSKAAPTSTRYAYDPCTAGRSGAGGNNFTSASTASQVIQGKTLGFKTPTSITMTSGLIARITPLYASTIIGIQVNSGPVLPAQGNVISSTGTSGGTSRKVSVFQSFGSVPSEFFPYVLFAPK